MVARVGVGARFWARVEKTEGCWLWMRPNGSTGYGQFRVAGQTVGAHRFAYELLVGSIPEGLTLDHLCRVRHCVNPAHMEVVTQRVNILRGDTLPARNAAKTHCPQGHPLAEENLCPDQVRKGKRACLVCRRVRVRKWHETLAARDAGAAFFDLTDGPSWP